MSAPPIRNPLVKFLYNNNPFYAISAVLMLFAVRKAFGTLRIGYIDCWAMMGVLAGYASLLAAIGVLIVRRGKVWEDARSIFLVLILLFLAVSVSADDLFVKMDSQWQGALLMLSGYGFSAIVMELVLWATRIRLPIAYRVPYHLLFALFYVAPWWCSPELHSRSPQDLQWMIMLFPVAAGLLFLTLLPAVRRGPAGVANNGTPWRWPWFPWSGFAFLMGAVGLRTFALCMTFGPLGPIWVQLSNGRRAIAFDTMWGPYFLIPPVLAVMVLMLEGSLATGNKRLIGRLMKCAPLILLLSLPYSNGRVFHGFLSTFTETVGSPIWLAVWLQLGFYAWATFRKVPRAAMGALATLCLLSIIDSQTLSFRTLADPQPWPLLAAGLMLAIVGIRRRSSAVTTVAGAMLTLGLFFTLPETWLHAFRMTVCYHVLWGIVIVDGLAFRDKFSVPLRIVGASQMPVASLIMMASPLTSEIPLGWRMTYVILLALLCIGIARLWRSRWYLYAFTSLLAIAGYGATVLGFRRAASAVGWAAVTSFAWSAATLLAAFLISAHKARWLPKRLFPRWSNGVPPPPDQTADPAG